MNMENKCDIQEKVLSLKTKGAQLAFFWISYIALLGVLCFLIWGGVTGKIDGGVAWTFTGIIGSYLCLFAWFIVAGFRMLKPGEARVLTLWGNYYGTLKNAGIYYVHPFCTSTPMPKVNTAATATTDASAATATLNTASLQMPNYKLSLKIRTLTNERQKINDNLGNPLNVGMVVTWRVVDTAKAMFAVDNFVDFLSFNCDSALRDIVKNYPYDSANDDLNETSASGKSIRDSAEEISLELRNMIQERVRVAGLEVIDARITNLSYAPEIAAAMLQRQQAAAVVAARHLIVEGAVGMVRLALERLREEGVVELDEERKATMVGNLMVVLCGEKGAQPVLNSGSLY